MTASNPTIQALVTFAAAARPFHLKYDPEATVGRVLGDALAFFEIAADGTTRYYLLFDGREAATTLTLSQVAAGEHGHSHQVSLALRTETISGDR